MKRARTVDEYVRLVKDALYEVEDMKAAIEFDEESMGSASRVIDDIHDSLKQMIVDMQEGNYHWRTGDLSFISIIRDMDEQVIPFRSLLIRINDTHKNGLEPDEE